MGARYYNPIAGRFLSIDPQSVTTDNIHGFNRYAYANNNPYRYVDPDGRMPLLALLAFPSAGAAMVQATVDAAVIVGGVYAMIHGNGGDDAGKGSSPANGSSQGDPNNGKGLNKALGAAGVAKGVSTTKSRINKIGPNPKADGQHTQFKTDPKTGRVTGYTQYDAAGNPVKRFRGQGKPHGGTEPPFILEPKSGKGTGSPPKVPRKPRPDELPRGY